MVWFFLCLLLLGGDGGWAICGIWSSSESESAKFIFLISERLIFGVGGRFDRDVDLFKIPTGSVLVVCLAVLGGVGGSYMVT